jgi:hypothetical protein
MSYFSVTLQRREGDNVLHADVFVNFRVQPRNRASSRGGNGAGFESRPGHTSGD